jgi:ATP synthase protein I
MTDAKPTAAKSPDDKPHGEASSGDRVVGLDKSQDFERRLAALAAERGRKLGGAQASFDPKRSGALGMGFRIGVDLVAALVVGVGIGYGLDLWFGTLPWVTILFFFLGSGAGVMNVFRAVKGMGYAVGYRDMPAKGSKAKREPPDDPAKL